MKIIHLCNYIQPKLGYQEYFLAKEHAKMGHNVTVITSDRYYPFPDYKNTVEKILGPRFVGSGIKQINGFKIIRLKTIIEIGKKVWLKGLEEEIIKEIPDIIICHGMDTFNTLRVSKLKSKCHFKLVLDEHPVTPFIKINFLKSIYYLFLNFKYIEKASDKLIVISKDGYKYINKYYKFKKKVQFISLGVDIDRFKYNKIWRKKLKLKYNLKSDDILLIYTGKITEDKGINFILSALNELNNPHIKLMVVGGGDINYITELKKQRDFIYIPQIANSELPKYFSMSDIGIWPSTATIGTLEAISCSLPVICNISVKERVNHNNGFAVTPTVKELKDCITLLVNSPKLRKEMGINGRRFVETELSWKVIAKRFLE